MRRVAYLGLGMLLGSTACGSSVDDVADPDVDSSVADTTVDGGAIDSKASDTASDGGPIDSTVADLGVDSGRDATPDAVSDSATDTAPDALDATPIDGGIDARDSATSDTAVDARSDGDAGCSSNSDCASDEMCDAPTCTGPGTCIKKPGIGVLCRTDSDMWCGCNGTDFMSVCNAHKAGVRVAHYGTCASTACGANGDCASLGADSKCSFGVGNCTVPGFCKAEAFCPGFLTDYCSCAGATVTTNPCKADLSGTRLATMGACP